MIQVTAGVLTRADNLLACRRRAGELHEGQWEFPGGKREGCETLPDCLRRELREELAIWAEIGPQLWYATHTYSGREPLELFFFHVPAYTGRVVNRAFAEIRWVPIAALAELDFLEADRGFIELLRRGEILPPQRTGRSPKALP